jgi:hypothetical protein
LALARPPTQEKEKKMRGKSRMMLVVPEKEWHVKEKEEKSERRESSGKGNLIQSTDPDQQPTS